jgi:UDP-N-acetylmuramate--alanine ligase
VACLDDPGAVELMEYAEGKDIHWQSYSLEVLEANYAAQNLKPDLGQGYRFEAYRRETKLAGVALQVPGQHNVQNALAALVVADLLNLDMGKAAKALGQFSGSGRRFEIMGEVGGILVVDDYGHHPTEIRATLSATRDRYPERKIWAVWQPHTYSRTQQLLDEFGTSFTTADVVVVLGVYAAREVQPEGFTHETIKAAINNMNTHLVQELDAAADFLLKEVGAGDVVIVFSAGDATQVSAQLLAGLQAKEGAV